MLQVKWIFFKCLRDFKINLIIWFLVSNTKPKTAQQIQTPKPELTQIILPKPVQKVVPPKQTGNEPVQTVPPVKKTEMKFISPLKENYEFKIGETARWNI